MSILYLNCSMGAAGDMLSAALIQLLPDKHAFLSRLNSLGIPDVTFELERCVRGGIAGQRMRVSVHGEHEGRFGNVGPDGSVRVAPEAVHTHAHHHTGIEDVRHIIESLFIPDDVKQDAISVFGSIADAESAVHGVAVPDVHFHEVGTMDALADVVAVCLLMHELNPDQVVSSPVSVGGGFVECAHGVLPVPAPATAVLLESVPIKGGPVDTELCTPTGAALVGHFATSFGEMPAMSISKVGYGMGEKELLQCNCVQAYLGNETEAPDDLSRYNACDDVGIVELSCNIDDMTAEDVAYLTERLMEVGALDAYCVPLTMKKGRPAVMVCALCDAAHEPDVVDALFKNSSTLGVRKKPCDRYTLDRTAEVFMSSFGPVHVKVANGHGVVRIKPEYDDIAEIASETGSAPAAVRERVIEEFRQQRGDALESYAESDPGLC